MKSSAAVRNLLMKPVQFFPVPLTVVGSFLASGQVTAPEPHLVQALLQETGTLYGCSVRESHIRLQAEVDPDRCTIDTMEIMPSLWTRSYYVEAIGHISEKVIQKYIPDQKKH